MIRGKRYKYVHFAALPPLFFDLQADPGEFNDLSGDPACRDAMLECAQKLLSWRLLHDDRTLTRSKLTDQGVVERGGPRRSGV